MTLREYKVELIDGVYYFRKYVDVIPRRGELLGFDNGRPGYAIGNSNELNEALGRVKAIQAEVIIKIEDKEIYVGDADYDVVLATVLSYLEKRAVEVVSIPDEYYRTEEFKRMATEFLNQCLRLAKGENKSMEMIADVCNHLDYMEIEVIRCIKGIEQIPESEV